MVLHKERVSGGSEQEGIGILHSWVDVLMTGGWTNSDDVKNWPFPSLVYRSTIVTLGIYIWLHRVRYCLKTWLQLYRCWCKLYRGVMPSSSGNNNMEPNMF